MEDCIFCKIVNNEIPSVKIWEDKKHIAILDINPNTEGVTLLITKKHFDSYAFDMPDSEYSDAMLAAKLVGKMLDKGLKVKRTALVMEGLGINHVHIKLYPIHGINEKFEEVLAAEKIYFDKYLGYITTQIGPHKNISELNEIAEKIKNANR
ncbi:MAG: HIT family protein [Candidatus Micrarchaeia archaeon]